MVMTMMMMKTSAEIYSKDKVKKNGKPVVSKNVSRGNTPKSRR